MILLTFSLSMSFSLMWFSELLLTHFQPLETKQQKKVILNLKFFKEADQKNICFVCGNERSEFSKQSIDYNNHIKYDHYPWHYIYFICYLHSKKEKDLNGVEYYVWSQFQEKKPDWIPIGETLHLRNFNFFLIFFSWNWRSPIG